MGWHRRLRLDRLKVGRTWGLLLATLAVSACVNSSPQSYSSNPYTSRLPTVIGGSRFPAQTGTLPPGDDTGPVLPTFRIPPNGQTVVQPVQEQASAIAPSGLRVALLAPLSGPNAERGQALVRAAQLALNTPDSPALDVLDTQGTAAGAAAAATAAISGGAGLILGPLTAQETAAAAGPASAANVGLLAFTSDAAQQRPLVWVLGLTPAQQVRRMVAAAGAQNKTRFAALLPPGDFGSALASALIQSVAGTNASTPDIRIVDGGIQQASVTVRDISGYASRRGPLEAQIRAARARQTPEGRKEAAELTRRSIPPPPFDALLLGDTGERLATIASLLPYYDIDAPAVRIMGPALWANPAARGGAGLIGAWYAAPDPAARTGFDQQYSAKFGTPAPGLADIANDAAAIARVVAHEGGFSAASLTRPAGFAGVNGVLALQPDGSVRRALALFEIQRGGAQMVEPAPETIGGPGS